MRIRKDERELFMESQKKDIFDRLVHLRIFRWFEPFYLKYKEVLLYLFFGGCTFFINVISYTLINISFGVNELVANVIAWVIAVFFAYFTNRIWVFDGKTEGAGAFLAQMMSFLGGRLVTLLVEEIIIYIFITRLEFASVVIKVIAQIIVIVLNYVFSKLWIFRKK